MAKMAIAVRSLSATLLTVSLSQDRSWAVGHLNCCTQNSTTSGGTLDRSSKIYGVVRLLGPSSGRYDEMMNGPSP